MLPHPKMLPKREPLPHSKCSRVIHARDGTLRGAVAHRPRSYPEQNLALMAPVPSARLGTVVSPRRAARAGARHLQCPLRAFAVHYGYQPKGCQAYRAKTKGKVERPFRYLLSAAAGMRA